MVVWHIDLGTELTDDCLQLRIVQLLHLLLLIQEEAGS